jgi:hypothetical protein
MNIAEIASQEAATKMKAVEKMANEGLDTETLLEKSNPPKTPISTAPLTWGVEMEFVFAFHESKIKLETLWAGGDSYCTDIIKKNLTYKFRRDTKNFKNPIDSDVLPNRVYNSWGIYNPATFGTATRAYHREAEQIVSDLLEEKCPWIDQHIDESRPIDEKTKSMYDAWLIMRDYSVCGVGSQNIPAWLPWVDSTTDWDSYGLELVSPVFRTDSDQGMKEVGEILSVVKGKSTDMTGAFITNQCGFHVHVQAPESLEVLKELAVLLIVYEAEIAKLHPHCRRPEHPNARYSVESNRLYFLHKDEEDIRRKTYGELDVSNEALARQPKGFLGDIRFSINSCQDQGEIALLMNWPRHGWGNEKGNRNRQVNFTAAARPPEAPYTIEFRQARGTLDANDVQKWVEFCIGLVRLAKYYVDNPGTFPITTFKSFSVDESGECVRERIYIMDLMNDMGMSEEDKDYWRERMARFQAKGGSLDRVDNKVPPEDDEDGQGIPGGDSADSPRNGPADTPSGISHSGDNTRGNLGGNNPVGNSGSGGRDPPPPPPTRKQSPPGSGGKILAEKEDDGDDDDDDEVVYGLAPAKGNKRPAEDDVNQEGSESKKQKTVSFYPFRISS